MGDQLLGMILNHCLTYHKDVGDVLVLSQERNVKKNGEGLAVSGQDNQLGHTTAQSLGSLVGSLLQLAVVGGRLNQVKDFLSRVRL